MKIETLIIVNSDGSKVFVNTDQITTIREQRYPHKDSLTIITTSAGEKVETTESFDSLISKLTEG